MKKQLIVHLLASILILSVSFSVNAQIVGGAATSKVTKQGQTQKLIENYFTLKGGLLFPASFNKPLPQTPDDVMNGNLDMKQGLFLEMGMGMNIGKKKVGFYFYPLLLSAYKSGKNLNVVNDSGTMPFIAAEVAERYGIFYRPINKLSLALYYRPGAIIPLGFDTGTISVEPFNKGLSFIRMSNTAGFSVQYRFVSVSYEYYTARPSLYVKQKPAFGENQTTAQGIVPLRMNIISFAFNFGK
jgi:hypothetical protein